MSSSSTKTPISICVDEINTKIVKKDFLLKRESKYTKESFLEKGTFYESKESYKLNLSTLVKIIQKQQEDIDMLKKKVEELEYAPGGLNASESEKLFKED